MSMTAAESALLDQLKAQVASQAAIVTALLVQCQSLATMLGGCTSRNTDQGFDLVYTFGKYIEKCGGVLPTDFKFPSDKVLPDISISPVTLGTPTKLETAT